MVFIKMEARVLILIFILLPVFAIGKKRCEHLRNKYAASVALFEECIVENSEPVQFCTNCTDKYIYLQQNYTILLNGDDDETNTTCREKYIDLDTYNVLKKSHDDVVENWKSAACQECFDGDVLSAEYEIGTFSSIFTELTKLVSNVNNCILKNPLDVCNKCLPDFGQVNIAYNKLMGEKDICWDIKDAVNKTQGRWYNGLKCPRPYIQYNEEYVILSSVAGGLTSFASVAWFFKKLWKKRRENYNPIQDSNSVESSRPDDAKDSLIVLE